VVVVVVMVAAGIAATRALLVQFTPALLRLFAALTVFSDLIVKALFGFANAFFAVAALVRAGGHNTAEQAAAQHE
jgi:hypothetical protein